MPEFGSERILVGKPDHHLGLVLVKFENLGSILELATSKRP